MQIQLSYTEHNVNNGSSLESLMIVLDGNLLIGIAAVVTSLSTLIWSVRRRT